jgi:hypothetical protein
VSRVDILSPGGVPDPAVATAPNLVVVVELPGTDYDRAFATMVAERTDALFVLMSPILTRDRKQIIDRAPKYRLPAIYEWREHVEVGGLMSYGGSLIELSRRVAAYVDRILKGAKPAEAHGRRLRAALGFLQRPPRVAEVRPDDSPALFGKPSSAKSAPIVDPG